MQEYLSSFPLKVKDEFALVSLRAVYFGQSEQTEQGGYRSVS